MHFSSQHRDMIMRLETICFNLRFSFRLKCHWLCNHAYFGNLVLLCILVSSVMLAAEDPLNSNSERNKVTAVELETKVAEDYAKFYNPG